MAKDLQISLLLDFYGEMLTEKQREMIEFYYNEDLSLAEIADNQGIHPGCFTAFQITRQLRKLIASWKCVAGNIYFFAQFVRQTGSLTHFFKAEIGGCASHTEHMSRQIDGVRPIAEGRTQPLKVSRRR